MCKKFFNKLIVSFLFFGIFSIFSTPASADSQNSYELTLKRQGMSLVSDLILEHETFNSIGLSLNEEVDGLMVDFGNGFEEFEAHDDGFGPNQLLFTSPTQQMQFILGDAEGRESLKIKVQVLDSVQNEKNSEFLTSELQASSVSIAKSFKVISREEWGADETLRIWNPESKTDKSTAPKNNPCLDIEKNYADQLRISSTKEYTADGQPLVWPIQIAKKLEKFVVHHTDSEIRDLNGDSRTDARDYRAIVRAIYSYHAFSRGWGDIGYNYIIDPLGNIYEGRAGGDKAIGAHTLCFNNGTMGIAIIGNYENNEIPEPAMQSLIQLIGQKSKKYKIDPKGVTNFRGKTVANVFGHKDVRPTACPGAALYSQLGKIRDRAALAGRNFSVNSVSVDKLDYNAELIGDLKVLKLNPGERKTVSIKFRNTGKKEWNNETWMHVSRNSDPNARVVSIVKGKNFVAANLKEKSVKPGKIGTFVVEAEAGFEAGDYAFEVSPVVNGRFKISRSSEYLALNVSTPDYSYKVIAQDFPKGDVFEGQNIAANLKLQNTGNVTWRNYGKNPITLGGSSPKDRASIFVKENPFRVGYMVQSEVVPGEVADFTLNLFMPEGNEGEVIERFTPVIENVKWLEDRALGFKVTLKKPVHLAKTTKIERLGTMYPGERRYVQVEMKNMGDLPWNSENFETTLLGRGIKVFTRKLVPTEPVEPGESTKIGFWVEAPLIGGQHNIHLRARFNDIEVRGAIANFVVAVPDPNLNASLVDQSKPVAEMRPGVPREFSVTFKNTGNTVWKKKGKNAVRLGTSAPLDRKSRLYHEGTWINESRSAELEEEEVLPGENGTFRFKMFTNSVRRFEENFQLVMEDYGWIKGGEVTWKVNALRAAKVIQKKVRITRIPEKALMILGPLIQESTLTLTSIIEVNLEENIPKINEEAPFRVRLSYGDSQSSLTSNVPFVVLNGSNQLLFNAAANKSVGIKKLANLMEVTLNGVSKSASVLRVVPKEPDGIVEILSMERRPSWNTDLNDNQFRGLIEVRVLEGEVAYINELFLEDYMKGLAEVSNSAHPEKQKTIAVLARTYARYYMSDLNRKFPNMPYDGSDDPAVFQRYLGYGVESRSPNFVAAVQSTKDIVVKYGGNLVKTPYFNQSDGRTRSAEEVWGWTHTPYLLSVPDPWSNNLTLNGHGVGLSGYGATAQAEAGKSFEEIIMYYYTGVVIEKLN